MARTKKTKTPPKTPKTPTKTRKTPTTTPTKTPTPSPQTPNRRLTKADILPRPFSTTPVKKRRFRPGTRALMEIRKYQKTTELLIPKLSLARVVRDLANERCERGETYRWASNALLALQTAAEKYLIQLLHDAQVCAFHAKRTTLMVTDFYLARRIRGVRKEALY
eukprot:TRINITY_DN14538_c0_g1_i3.p1 TRINITY_DN14538_c0_g1~~TRINITY_DN14538_c0_g1_i3.p1  ORF type:complete len:165 (+),score=36.19 TRINITY_DN14538_c0_g1_i3:97-591(+)